MKNPDVLADNESYNENKKDMEDDVISETFFNILKGKRNYSARCFTNFSTSDGKSESLSGRRLAVKLSPLDTIDNILPNPCSEEFDQSNIDILLSLFPTAWSSAPYENRYMLPNFGSTVRLKYNERGPAELGKHRGMQYEFVSNDAKNYVCDNDVVIGKLGEKFAIGNKVYTLGSSEPRNYGTGVRTGKCRPTGTQASKAEILKAYPAAAPIVDNLISLAKELGITDPGWLANLINMESSFNPQAVNSKSGASGLIQFMPSTARDYGTTVQKLRKMTAQQQWPYITKYLKSKPKRWSLASDVYMSVFYPWGMGKPPNTSLADHFAKRQVRKYEKTGGKKGFKDYNRAYAVFKDQNGGIITKQDYANKANRKAKLPTHFCAPGEKP